MAAILIGATAAVLATAFIGWSWGWFTT